MLANDLASEEKPQSRARQKPHWLRFSLRTLLLMMLVLGVFFGWFGKIAIQARRQQKIVAMMHELGGEVVYCDSRGLWVHGRPPQGPWLLREIFGDEAFSRVECVDFQRSISDAELARLVGLEQLQYVHANGGITDKGMKYLAQVPNLAGLNLHSSAITKDGLKQLAGADHLEVLSLSYASDETLENIDSISGLKTLCLFGTAVTSAGLAPVGRLNKLQSIDFWHSNRIGKGGIAHLKSLKELKQVEFHYTTVSDDSFHQLAQLESLERFAFGRDNLSESGVAAIAKLKNLTHLSLPYAGIEDAAIAEWRELKSLKHLALVGNKITDDCVDDLAWIGRVGQLEYLDITTTYISRWGMEELNERLPGCCIRWAEPSGGVIFEITNGVRTPSKTRLRLSSPILRLNLDE